MAMAGYFSAAVDFPTSLYWNDLKEFYPNAKVVVGLRTNAQMWVKSFRTDPGERRAAPAAFPTHYWNADLGC